MNKKTRTPEIRIKEYQDDWEQYVLSEIATMHARIGWQNLRTSEFLDNGEYLLITGTDFVDGKINYATCHYVEKERYEQDKNIQLKNGSILITKDGTLGKVAYVQDLTMPATLNAGVFNVEIKNENKVDEKYLFQYLKAPLLMSYVAQRATGGTIKHLNQGILVDFPIKMPQIDEQIEIGQFLHNLDKYFLLHKKEYERLCCVRKSMVESMFPQDGKDVPAIRFKQFTDPWVYRSFSEIFIERHVIDTISDEYPQLSFTIEEGVIRPEDRKTNKRDFLILDIENKKYLQTELNDIIYNPANVIYGAIHRNRLGKGCVSPIYKIFYTSQDPTFMECIVRHPRFINTISRSMEGTVKKLRTLKPEAFLKMNAYIAPTVEEQKMIGNFFLELDKLIAVEETEMEKIDHIRKTCVEKMLI